MIDMPNAPDRKIPTVDWSSRLVINVQLVAGEGLPLTVENPATGEAILTLNQASLKQVDEAVRAAKSSFESGVWADGETRRDVLLWLADLLACLPV